jgi:hypothetical protein
MVVLVPPRRSPYMPSIRLLLIQGVLAGGALLCAGWSWS